MTECVCVSEEDRWDSTLKFVDLWGWDQIKNEGFLRLEWVVVRSCLVR